MTKEQIIHYNKLADPHLFTIISVLTGLCWLFSESFFVFMLLFFYLVAVLSSRLYVYYVIKHITWNVEQIHDKLFLDETAICSLTISNASRLPIGKCMFRFRSQDGLKWKYENDPYEQNGNSYKINLSLLPSSDKTYTLIALACKRGTFRWEEAEIIVSDPFNFITIHISFREMVSPLFAVYPRLRKLGIPEIKQWRHGFRKAIVSPLSDETKIIGIKAYENETFRSIHWGATAKTGKLYAKKYEPSQVDQYAVYLNLAGQNNVMLRSDLEHLIEQTAGLCNQLFKQNCSFELWINCLSDKGIIHLKSGNNRKHLQSTLYLLASITDMSTPIPTLYFYQTGFLKQESQSIPLIIGAPPNHANTIKKIWVQVYR